MQGSSQARVAHRRGMRHADRDGAGRGRGAAHRLRAGGTRAAARAAPRLRRRRPWDVAASDRGAERRVHRRGLGCAGREPFVRRAGVVPSADFADCLAAFVAALGLGRAHVAGLSFGGMLALELQRRQPFPSRGCWRCSVRTPAGRARSAGGRAAAPARVPAPRRAAGRGVREGDARDDVLAVGGAGAGRCLRRAHGGLPPRWVPRHGALVRRGRPAGGAWAHRCADAAAVRRRGRARPAGRRRGAAERDSGGAAGAGGGGARLERRGPERGPPSCAPSSARPPPARSAGRADERPAAANGSGAPPTAAPSPGRGALGGIGRNWRRRSARGASQNRNGLRIG